MSNDLNLNDLFSGAVGTDTGVPLLSPQTSQTIMGNLGPMVVAGAAGRAAEDITATDAILITLMLDVSSSMGGFERALADGYNMVKEAFAKSKEADSVLISLWLFNHNQKLVHSYVPVADAEKLTTNDLMTSGYTSLYDTWCDALAANVAYAQQLRASGTPCRSIAVLMTDGEDVGSKRRSPKDCADLSRDLLKSEQFVLAFVGLGNGDFQNVAKSMGVQDNSIHVCKNMTESGLRQTFGMISQSAIRVSQSAITVGNNGFFT